MKSRIAVLLALLFLFSATQHAQSICAAKNCCGATSFADCPDQGCGGDPELNKKKNTRDTPTAAEITKKSIADILQMTFPAAWKSGTKRILLEGWGEGNGARVNAFLIHAKNYTSGAESCNCGLKLDSNNDYHIVLVQKRSFGEANSITAEISPRIRPAGWTIKKLRRLAKEKAYVRVTGWMMLDTQHIKRPLHRLSNWEIHPVTKFEVCTSSVSQCDAGSGWVNLEDAP